MDIEQSKQDKIKNQIIKIELNKEGIEQDNGLKGKIVEKVVFDRNKHIFPYKNWKTVIFTNCFIIFSLTQLSTMQRIQSLSHEFL